MLSIAGLTLGAKLAGMFLLGVMAIIFAAGNSGRRAGLAAAERGAAAKAAQVQKEMAVADAAGPRSRRDVLDRMRDGKF